MKHIHEDFHAVVHGILRQYVEGDFFQANIDVATGLAAAWWLDGRVVATGTAPRGHSLFGF